MDPHLLLLRPATELAARPESRAAQRALETKCEVVLMGKNGVDGVYDANPERDPHEDYSGRTGAASRAR